MSTPSLRSRAVLGSVFSLVILAAPLSIVLGLTPAAANEKETPVGPMAHVVRPFLTAAPRAFPPPSFTFTVNTTNDTDAAHASGGVCADAAGQCSIRAAVDVANAINQTVQINIPAGSYVLTLGELTVTDPAGVQLVGAGAATTTIAATGSNVSLDVTAAGSSANGGFAGLTNATVTGGEGTLVATTNSTMVLSGAIISNATASDGAGVENSGQFWATSSAFIGNTAIDSGGAIFDEDGSVRLNGDLFVGNTAGAPSSNEGGGAIYQNDGPIAIDNSTFESNAVHSTADADGGAIDARDAMELTNDVFSGNSATTSSTTGSAFGGAIFDDYGLNSVANSTFIANSVAGASTVTSEGGALYDANAVMISGSAFQSNTATNGIGGAISEVSDGLLLVGSTVSGNSATGPATSHDGEGGGIYSIDVGSLSNTTVSGNHADQQGGGLWEDDGYLMTNSLVANNSANEGAGIFADWSMQAIASAVVDNVTSGAADAGGGVFEAPSTNNRVDFQAVTVAGNVSDAGAGFAIESDAQAGGGTLASSTVADNRTPGGTEADCALIGTPPLGLPLGSAGGNVTGDTSCRFTTSSDRQGPNAQGYWMVASDGGIFDYDTGYFGSMGGKPLNTPVVGMARTPGNQGYWEVASDGGIFNFGDAGFYGSQSGKPLNAPVVGIAPTPDGKGYWEVASDGGVFTFGDAGFYGSMGGRPLNKPIVAIAVTPDGRGYWEVASDGGVFNFGDAGFFGSMGGHPLNKPIVGVASAIDGAGYYEVASDGGVFNFGSAHFFGSAGGLHLNEPVVGIAAAPDNAGYWTFASDGGVFNYGTGSLFKGSAGSLHLVKPVVAGTGT